MSKNFESFRGFLGSVCFSLYLNINLHQARKNRRGAGFCIFLHETLFYKIKLESDVEFLCGEFQF